MRVPRFGSLVILASAVLLPACGGDDGAISKTDTTEAATVDTTAVATTEDEGALPEFSWDFDSICTAHVGFSGTTAYSSGPGPHPILLFEEQSDGSFSEYLVPDEWGIEEDDNLEDTSEYADLELVACANLDQQMPTGIECQFGGEGKQITLELVDTRYEVTVYEAATAEVLHTTTLETDTTDCPMLWSGQEGDTQWVFTPLPEDYTNALKDVVAPAE